MIRYIIWYIPPRMHWALMYGVLVVLLLLMLSMLLLWKVVVASGFSIVASVVTLMSRSILSCSLCCCLRFNFDVIRFLIAVVDEVVCIATWMSTLLIAL